MADFVVPNLDPAVVGFTTSVNFNYSNIFFEPPVVTDGLVLNLDANKTTSYPGSGNTWTDISGQNNNASLTNVSFNNVTVNFSSIVFNGSSTSRGTIPASSSLNLTDSSQFSIEAWIYYDSSSGVGENSQIFTADAGDTNPLNWQFRVNESNNKLEFLYQTGATRATAVAKSSNTSITQDVWTHVAITYGSSTLSFYINGNLDVSYSVPTIYSTSKNIGIAGFNNDDISFNDTFNGRIALIRAYKNKTLSSNEILTSSRTGFIEVSNGTVNNIDLSSQVTETRPGWLTGRRPAQGQVFPRGVYNK